MSTVVHDNRVIDTTLPQARVQIVTHDGEFAGGAIFLNREGDIVAEFRIASSELPCLMDLRSALDEAMGEFARLKQ